VIELPTECRLRAVSTFPGKADIRPQQPARIGLDRAWRN